MQLNVSSIQHFSVGDGDGIRTTVFLKGCNLRCPWCHNPETWETCPTILHYDHGDMENGHLIDIRDILDEVLEDQDFYGSDGGVTISGGEPLLQAEGVSVLVKELLKEGIPTVIDTAGCVPYAAFRQLGGDVHTYFFDLKACDTEGYRYVGGDFDRVYENLCRLIADGRRVRVRIPLIPHFNDAPDYSRRMCDILLTAGAREVDLLPFHRLGSGKYTAMGLTYPYRNQPPMSRTHAQEVAAVYQPHFTVRIDG